MAAARFFLACLLLTFATAGFGQADEGRTFDVITTAPRKVLNGGSKSDGVLASVANQAVPALQGGFEDVKSALNLKAPIPPRNGLTATITEMSGLDEFDEATKAGKSIMYFWKDWQSSRRSGELLTRFVDMAFDLPPEFPCLKFYTVNGNKEKDLMDQLRIQSGGHPDLPAFMAFNKNQGVIPLVNANVTNMWPWFEYFVETYPGC